MSIIILSIDGGGVRGILPLYLLNELRLRLDEENVNLPFYKLFNLIAGTSTGSLIALMLTADIKYNDNYKLKLLMDLYTNSSHIIFPKQKFKIYGYIKQFFTSKYKQKNLYEILDNLFGYLTLKDGLTNLLIPVLNLKDSNPYFFKNRPKYHKFHSDLNFYIKDIGIAATAAPTYFPPAMIYPINHNKAFYFIDGGVYANDPSLCAFIEALKIFNQEEHFILISLGTGEKQLNFNIDNPNSWGIFEWTNPCNHFPLLSILANIQPKLAQHMLKNLPKVSLYRFNIDLEGDGFSLDDSSSEYINFLHKKGDELIKANSKKIDDLVRLIKRN